MARLVLSLFVFFAAQGQNLAPATDEGVVRVGPGVNAPRIKAQIEPEYSKAGRQAKVQGSVLIDCIVDERGIPTNISVLSPLGFGLDEKAVEAISRWRFQPATKDGVPVKVEATVEVHFRLLGLAFDAKTESQRALFNQTVSSVKTQQDGKPTSEQIKNIERLAHENFAPAEYLLALWQLSKLTSLGGTAEGLTLLQKSAHKKYAPALFYLGALSLEGKFVSKDPAQGVTLWREAATLGDAHAQYQLANKYEVGDGVERDFDSAIRYFRLCAASGTPMCQFRLGKLLLSRYRADDNLRKTTLNSPKPNRRNIVEAIAWLELAADHGIAPAKEMLENRISTPHRR
jgi:TonB family protein